jgi:hypothetical protein
VNLGAENRKKTLAALVLGGLALAMVVYRILNPAGTPPPPAAMNVRASNNPVPSPAQPVSRRMTTNKPAANRKTSVAPASLDPTLQLGLLRASEDTKYTGAGRNIFRAEIEIPKPVASAVPEVKPEPQGPPPPPPPPPINLKFFGFASKPGEPKRIFLSKGEDVFIAGEGDIVDRRYKVLRIGPASVEIEDVLNNNRQSIPLTQG